ncbi:aldo/keto reductase [Pseudofrankia asymbiotica]|uniref:NADP-dependent oxidoreductase domain-containing protein n=1 Tax=Pseudofrankia asymbiotica TaxID=1834516 RepID=A0A1V2I7M3_9ACTN|nr:aldo/keto reductase [Pseudofrankia asymbiotica]ONH28040.1 hypothetical protein BL253_20795 [Pseudofrankia asymbiotica]
MRYSRLGGTGLQISTVILGAAQFGESVDGTVAGDLVREALDLGITTFDTADVYAGGRSEGMLAGALPAGLRDQLVVCTKVGLRVGDDDAAHAAGASATGHDQAARWRAGIAPTDQGLSRKHIMSAVEASLRGLGIDYIDLYQVHRFDPSTPLDETLSALDALVQSGKVRYLGCSGYAAWQLCLALGASREHGLERFASTQVRYSVADRAGEQELLPACEATSVGALAFQVLAGGVLAAPPDDAAEPRAGSRASRASVRGRYWNDTVRARSAKLRAVAAELGRDPVETALAWALGHPAIDAVIIGASRPGQLAAAAAAAERPLTPGERRRVTDAVD